MPRRNNGPRLRFLEKRQCYSIVWSEGERSRERSTGTADSDEAQIVFTEFLQESLRDSGPRKPEQILITDILTDYASERGPKVKAGERISYALMPLIEFWRGKTCNVVTRQSCEAYTDWRARSAGTVRRKLTPVRAAINHAVRENRLTRGSAVHLPARPPSKTKFLTRDEADRLLEAAASLPKAGPYMKLFVAIALHTGQRKEAILTLRWPQVDLDSQTIN